MLQRNPGWRNTCGSASDPGRPWIACDLRSWNSGRSSSSERSTQGRGTYGVTLSREERCQTEIRQIEQFAEIPPFERLTFGCGLDLNKRAISRANDIAVDRSTTVLDIIEVEDRHAAHDTDTDSGNRWRQRVSIQSSLPA